MMKANGVRGVALVAMVLALGLGGGCSQPTTPAPGAASAEPGVSAARLAQLELANAELRAQVEQLWQESKANTERLDSIVAAKVDAAMARRVEDAAREEVSRVLASDAQLRDVIRKAAAQVGAAGGVRHGADAGGREPRETPDERRRRREDEALERTAKELGLTDAQRESMRDANAGIREEIGKRIAEMRDKGDFSPDRIRTELDAIKKQYDEKLRGFLDETQFEAFQKRPNPMSMAQAWLGAGRRPGRADGGPLPADK